MISMRRQLARSGILIVWFSVLPALMSKLALGAGSITIRYDIRNNSYLWGFQID